MTGHELSERMRLIRERVIELYGEGYVARDLAFAIDEAVALEARVAALRTQAANLTNHLCESGKKREAAEARVAELEGQASEHKWHPDYDEEQGRVIEHCFNCNAPRECHYPGKVKP